MVKLKNVQFRKGVGVFVCRTDLVTVAQSGTGQCTVSAISLQYCDLLLTTLSARVGGDAAHLVAAG